MQMFLNELGSSVLQLMVFSLIPFIWWLCTARKKEGFFAWLGLKKPSGTPAWKLLLMIIATAAAFLLVTGVLSPYLVGDTETAVSQFDGKGAAAIPTVLVYAVLHTALSEEILFRGFLLKRIAAKFGFMAGNIIQSLLFGLLHGALFFSSVGPVPAVVITLLTGAVAFVMGWINEKKAGGSILPSWCVHAIANIVTGLIAAF